MNYNKIKRYDISNGCGIRTSIFFNGCTFKCKGCFNYELWDFKGGKPFDEEAKKYLFSLLDDPHCTGLSVLGGEPLQQGPELKVLLEEVKEEYGDNKNIWLWTGYYLDELNEEQKEIVNLCDYVVDGPFIEEKSGIKLRFRGSSNQNIWKKNENGVLEIVNMDNVV